MQPTPQQNTLADLWADFTARHHIRDGDATARLERAKRFTQRLVFIREKINDAVGNNHVDQLPGKGMFSISPFRDSTFSMTDLRLFGSEREHLVGHCQGAGFAHRAYASCGKQHVEASARFQIEQVRQCGLAIFELFLDFADDQTFGLRRQQQPYDAQPGLGSHGGEHVGVFLLLARCFCE